MADFNDILSAATSASNMINSTLTENGITNLASTARGLVVDLLTISIDDMCNFNARNYAYMTYHMLRNIHEKNITLDTLGENAYSNGNSELPSMSPQKPSYTDGNNYYVDFMEKIHVNEANGQLTTRTTDYMSNPAKRSNLFSTSNKYWDSETSNTFDAEATPLLGSTVRNGTVDYTGSSSDKNSILYKMQLLYQKQKVNTIISSFHTQPGAVKYEGQVGSTFGESHGRNLLTLQAETNESAGYSVNGYDNPYCRVWTHHYMYDRLSKTMRANTGGINYWGKAFEWNEEDNGHDADTIKRLYGDQIGQNYDYAWRGQRNQERRRENSVLDFNGKGDTGLPIIAPKFGGGEKANIHTKSCMFSIENLAWKDYDPYSFEQALSWEQRGPFGGRIMWFPPYNIRISENATAKWNSNEFIGRGEPVYTYANSERTGSLSFTMLTDHPSSVDYATWWDNQEGDLGDAIRKQWGEGNKETDFLRYFAGCMGDDSQKANGSEDNIIEKPTPMMDEYTIEPLIGMEGKKEYTKEIHNHTGHIETPPLPETYTQPESQPETVEFYMFFPNNYTGYLDSKGDGDEQGAQYDKYNIPEGPKVNAILYLLAGRNAQKTDGYNDSELLPNTVTNEYLTNKAIGYEMGESSGITTTDYKTSKEYIRGGTNACPWTAVERYWGYRVDHIQKSNNKGGTTYICNMGKDGTLDTTIDNINTHNQGVNGTDLQDFPSKSAFNLKVSEYLTYAKTENAYSFAEVAMAMYSEKVLNKPLVYSYLEGKLDNSAKERVNKLIEIFSDTGRKLEKIECRGVSNQHGQTSKNNSYEDSKSTVTRRNKALAKNRCDTVVSWIQQKWPEVTNASSDDESWDSDHTITDTGNNINSGVSTPNAKIYRSAHCVMTFSTSATTSATDTNEEKAVKSEHFELLSFWNNSKEYTMGDVVQKDKKAYSAVQDITKTEDETWEGPALTDTVYWDELETEGEYDKTKSYVVGQYIIYNEYVYEVIKDIDGEVDFDQDASFIGYEGFKWVKKETKDNGDVWNYYKKDTTSTYYQQKAGSTTTTEKTKELTLTMAQIRQFFKTSPYCGVQSSVIEDNEKYRGDFDELYAYPTGILTKKNPYKWTRYAKDDIVKHDNKYYICKINADCNEKFYFNDWIDDDWLKLDNNELKDYFKITYKVVDTDKKSKAKEKNLCLFDDKWHICTKILTEEEGRAKTTVPNVSNEYWQSVNTFSGTKNYSAGDAVAYGNKVYTLNPGESITYTAGNPENKFKKSQWTHQEHTTYSPFESYKYGDYVQDTLFYVCINDIAGVEKQVWSEDISDAVKGLAENECNGDYSWNGNYPYKPNDIIIKDNEYYWCSNDYSLNDYDDLKKYQFDETNWELAQDDKLYSTKFTKDDFTIQKQAATILCWPEDDFRSQVAAQGSSFTPTTITYSSIDMGTYGSGDTFGDSVTTSTDLATYVHQCVTTGVLSFTNKENEYLSLKISEKELEHDLATTCDYIAFYKLLGMATKIINDDGKEYEPCTDPVDSFEELEEKIKTNEAKCDETLWVDRGDNILIQVCSLLDDGVKSRFDAKNLSGDWNKLRYDQEYFFYRRYFADHPFVFEKLQDKIKYFQPAFHSMTPEGFNARLTFLQQCTRQGNTKTMSDVGGDTANNLAFGRAPYCVLRLGDFYYQMIVIDSISFDYSVSDGLQWDMNTEGNGLQPMLCNVSINFKFIGGGDITGPVRRLQNAMSFNYYANTSFYDNRADRLVYKENIQTMGGAGNNTVVDDQSYAYQGKMYSGKERPIVYVTDTGTKSSDTAVK